MKKFILIVAILTLVTALIGCGGGGGGSKDSAKVSGDDTLTTEIIGLLNAIASAFVKEDAAALANCLVFPFTIQNNYSGINVTYNSYDEFIDDFKFSEGAFTIDIQKYYISNAHFQDNGETGNVTYNAYIYAVIPGLGSGAENDEINLNLKKVDEKWKVSKYHVVTSVAASSFNSLNKSLNPSIFGSINIINE